MLAAVGERRDRARMALECLRLAGGELPDADIVVAAGRGEFCWAAEGNRHHLGRAGAELLGLRCVIDSPQLVLALNALESRGRVRTLSTPKLLALEGQEASVIIGDRRGFQVTTTINQVTSETIEFLESGVILRVTPQVDEAGNVERMPHRLVVKVE